MSLHAKSHQKMAAELRSIWLRRRPLSLDVASNVHPSDVFIIRDVIRRSKGESCRQKMHLNVVSSGRRNPKTAPHKAVDARINISQSSPSAYFGLLLYRTAKRFWITRSPLNHFDNVLGLDFGDLSIAENARELLNDYSNNIWANKLTVR